MSSLVSYGYYYRHNSYDAWTYNNLLYYLIYLTAVTALSDTTIMELTAQQVEKHLANMHDVYSKEEVTRMLLSIRLAADADEERMTKYQIHPEHIFTVARDQYKEILDGLNKEFKQSIKYMDFDNGTYSIHLDSDNKIEVEIDSRVIADDVIEELFDLIPDEDDFYEHLKQQVAGDDNKDQTQEDLQIMELKSEFINPVTTKSRKLEIMKILWDDFKIDFDGPEE